MPQILKAVSGAPLSINEENKTMRVIMSTKSVDRDGDIVEPKGMDTGNFLKNPVVLWAHDSSKPPIAKIETVEIGDSQVEGEVKFADTPFAQEIFGLYKGGFLKSWSVGFTGKEGLVDPIVEEGSFKGYHFKGSELLELSAVPVPANPEALAKCAEVVKDTKLQKYFKSLMPSHEQEETVKSLEDFQKEYKDADDDQKEAVYAEFLKSEHTADDQHIVSTSTGDILTIDSNKSLLTGIRECKESDLTVADGCFKKSIDERLSKVDKNVVVGEEADSKIIFDIIKADDNIVKEARIVAVEVIIPDSIKSKDTHSVQEPSHRDESEKDLDVQETRKLELAVMHSKLATLKLKYS